MIPVFDSPVASLLVPWKWVLVLAEATPGLRFIMPATEKKMSLVTVFFKTQWSLLLHRLVGSSKGRVKVACDSVRARVHISSYLLKKMFDSNRIPSSS